MDLLHSVWLSLLQGLTEFLPISSSGHLILLPRLLDWKDQGLAFDVAVHFGTLLAVVLYFHKDLIAMARAWFSSLAGGASTDDSRLAWGIIIASVPVGIAGLLINGNDGILRDPMVIAAATAGFGLLLWVADIKGKHNHDEHRLSWREVLIIGFAQAFALIPGTSRSGITITAGLALGLTRSGAARFSFLLSIPVITMAALLELTGLVSQQEPVAWLSLGIGLLVSFVVAFLTIRWFLAFVERMGMLPFVIYRLLLAALIFAVFW